MRVQRCNVLDDAWLSTQPVSVGPVERRTRDPSFYATVTDAEERRVLRVDIYEAAADLNGFEEVITWRGHVLIGTGSYAHAVCVESRCTVTYALDAYFGSFYATESYLLIASADRLRRVQPDRTLAWTSEPLGIDGVIISEATLQHVAGHGEWDPPDGWQPFTLRAADGRRVE